jgi:hypothetical protein
MKTSHALLLSRIRWTPALYFDFGLSLVLPVNNAFGNGKGGAGDLSPKVASEALASARLSSNPKSLGKVVLSVSSSFPAVFAQFFGGAGHV